MRQCEHHNEAMGSWFTWHALTYPYDHERENQRDGTSARGKAGTPSRLNRPHRCIGVVSSRMGAYSSLRKRGWMDNESQQSIPWRHWGGYMLQALTPVAVLE